MTIQENADPDVRRDLAEFFERLVPENTPWFRHTTEGSRRHAFAHPRRPHFDQPFDSRSSGGSIGLGTWQAIYVFEHRTDPQIRDILLHIMGE